MDILAAIEARTSAIRLGEPGPTEEQLSRILRAAVRAPDHGRLSPWRFVVIERAARTRFGEILRQARRRRVPDTAPSDLDAEAAKAVRAPMIIVVAAAITPGRIPPIEQILSAGAGVENMVLAASALGLSTMWKTGEPAYDDEVKRALGLRSEDEIVAFLYIGTAIGVAPPREVSLEGLVQRL